MKYTVRIYNQPRPVTFTVDLRPDQMRLLERWLVAGQPNLVSYAPAEPYQPEPDAPWPIGPTLEDM